jgi:hypothetical protein
MGATRFSRSSRLSAIAVQSGYSSSSSQPSQS